MKIGVDAGALGINDKRLELGVYWVTLNLLKELSRLDGNNSYELYSFEKIDLSVLDNLGKRMHNRVLKPKKGWFEIRLPLELLLHKVDLFIGPSQAIPFGSPHSIVILHDNNFLFNPFNYPGTSAKLARLTERAVHKASNIVCVSDSVKKKVSTSYGLSTEKITVAHPGTNDTFAGKGFEYKGKYPYFLFVGALKPGKNVPLILRSFSEFIKTQKKIFDLYLVGGDYWKDPQIDILIKELNLGERVKQPGHVPVSDLAAYYRGAVAFVSPSFYEGFCLPAVEAMASGCPVIGSTTGAFPEVVGDSGILVDPQDVQGLTEALATMANNEKARREYIKKGLARSKRYSWRKFAEKVYEIIKRYE